MSDEPQTEDTMIAALLREREGLVQRGLKDRVAQVDEQLKLRGFKRTPAKAADKTPPADPAKTPPADPEKTPAAAEQQAPKGRQQQAPQQT